MENYNFDNLYKNLVTLLIKEQNSEGFWSGHLASSALATAVAMVAFKTEGRPGSGEQTDLALLWLIRHVNPDGGFGDTPESTSNVSTSLLCYAAVSLCQSEKIPCIAILKGLEKYLLTQKIDLNSGNITASVLKYYGKDYTFSVPILSMLVICKVLDDRTIDSIPQLPFELTIFPASWYNLFKMQVVSYAIPALVAVGIFIHKNRTYRFPLIKIIRDRSIRPALKKLSAMLPESGGFLEAIPLTAFACMCLIVSGVDCGIVIRKGMSFLKNQQRPDGSFPIDTNLSTWVTTLSIKALSHDAYRFLSAESIENLKKHLLSLQYKQKHPFNQALPGGWGWTNASGSVPDADDTPGAILALLELYNATDEETTAILNGCKWLLNLQNSNGGFPTFCKGWNRLPFDSSCADLTGHAVAAMTFTLDHVKNIPGLLRVKLQTSIHKAVKYLNRQQFQDGSWVPLWFGNQFTPDKKNQVYGTAKVVSYLQDCMHQTNILDDSLKSSLQVMIDKGTRYLLLLQNPDGSWGGARNIEGSVEETALAICALVRTHKEQCRQGLQWLQNKYNSLGLVPSPIGLYFATLWYDEKMYPLVFYIEALRRYSEAYIENASV